MIIIFLTLKYLDAHQVRNKSLNFLRQILLPIIPKTNLEIESHFPKFRIFSKSSFQNLLLASLRIHFVSHLFIPSLLPHPSAHFFKIFSHHFSFTHSRLQSYVRLGLHANNSYQIILYLTRARRRAKVIETPRSRTHTRAAETHKTSRPRTAQEAAASSAEKSSLDRACSQPCGISSAPDAIKLIDASLINTGRGHTATTGVFCRRSANI